MRKAKAKTLTKWNPWGPGVSPVIRTFTVVGPTNSTTQSDWECFIRIRIMDPEYREEVFEHGIPTYHSQMKKALKQH